jgi:hypothetical protein
VITFGAAPIYRQTDRFGRCGARNQCSQHELPIRSNEPDNLCTFVSAPLILAGYCGVTAIFWKQFWTPGDFWMEGQSRARGLFWDFFKNFALAGGLLLITFGTGASSVELFFSSPLSSSHPYSLGFK